MDELAIYNRRLDASEIQAIYAAGAGGKCLPASPPVITTHPASQAAVAWNPVTFSVAATGTAPLAYQWRCNGQNIAGATASSYSIAHVEPKHVGSYSVYVSNAAGHVTSANAQLTVSQPDTDTDTLPDWWEMKHFGNITPSGGTDSDQDGALNSAEYTEGTDPNSLSFLVSFPDDHVTADSVIGTIEVLKGDATGGEMAVLVNNDDFDEAVWIPCSATFSVPLPTPNTTYEIWVGLRGKAGADSSQSWDATKITRDTLPPEIHITSPPQLTLTTSQSLLEIIGYSVEPLSTLRYDLVNSEGSQTDLEAFVTDQYYDPELKKFTRNDFQAFDLPLVEGLNTITLRATDLAGNTAVVTLQVTLVSDLIPPSVQVLWPSQGMRIVGNTFTLDGTVDDTSASVTLQLQSAAGELSEFSALIERDGHFWVEDVSLPDGTSTITVTGQDVWNNTASTTLSVTKSSLPFTIELPAEEELHNPVVTLSGAVPAGYTVRVNGALAQVDGEVWTINSPVNAGGVASFTAVAYPPNQDLNPAEAHQQKASKDKPSRLYVESDDEDVYSYLHTLTETIGEPGGEASDWVLAEMETVKIQNWLSGQDSDGQWDVRQLSEGQNLPRAENVCNKTITWPASKWPELLPGVWEPEESCPGLRPPSTLPIIGMEHCEVNTKPIVRKGEYISYVGAQYGQWYRVTQNEHYARTAQTTLKLFTGGKTGVRRQNLFVFTASAAEILDKRALPPFYENTPWRPIPPTAIRLGGCGTLGNDGRTYVSIPDSKTIDVTPSIKGKPIFTFNVASQKHKLVITAHNGSISAVLDPLRITSSAKYAIGMKITLGTAFVPNLPEEPQKGLVKWQLAPEFKNSIICWVWLPDPQDPSSNVLTPVDESYYDLAYAITGYPIDSAKLQHETTCAWWLTGSSTGFEAKPNLVAMHLTFSNGKQVSITAQGVLGMHRPTAVWLQNLYQSGVVYGRNYLGALQVQIGEFGMQANGALFLNVDSISLRPGRFGCTQLLVRDSLVLSFSDWRLDNSLPYDYMTYTYDPSLNVYSGRYFFTDAPATAGGGYMWDIFKQYFQYRPDTPGSIWVTVGVSQWSWKGHIIHAGTPEGYEWVDKFFTHSQRIDPSTELPVWSLRVLNY